MNVYIQMSGMEKNKMVTKDEDEQKLCFQSGKKKARCFWNVTIVQTGFNRNLKFVVWRYPSLSHSFTEIMDYCPETSNSLFHYLLNTEKKTGTPFLTRETYMYMLLRCSCSISCE